VATTLLEAGLTQTLWMTGQTLHPPARTQVLLKGCPYNSTWLADGSFQLITSHDDHAVQVK